MGNVISIYKDSIKTVHLNLFQNEARYIKGTDGCMIDAWDIEEALKIFKINNPRQNRQRKQYAVN